MALPSIRAVGAETGKRALGVAMEPAKDLAGQVTSPITKLTAPVTQLIKDAVKRDEKDEKILQQETKQTSILEKLFKLEEKREKRQKKAADAAKASNVSKGLQVGDKLTKDAVKTDKDGNPIEGLPEEEEGGLLSTIAKVLVVVTLKKIITKILAAAVFLGTIVLPALEGFFESSVFKTIKDFVVDRWPAVKEAFVESIAIILDFFDDITGNIKTLFKEVFSIFDKKEGEGFASEKLLKSITKFSVNSLNDIGQTLLSTADMALDLLLSMFGITDQETVIRDALKSADDFTNRIINAAVDLTKLVFDETIAAIKNAGALVGTAIADTLSGLKNLGKIIYAEIYDSLPGFAQNGLDAIGMTPDRDFIPDSLKVKDAEPVSDLPDPADAPGASTSEDENLRVRARVKELYKQVNAGEISREEYIAEINKLKPVEPVPATQGEDKANQTKSIEELSNQDKTPNVNIIDQSVKTSTATSATQNISGAQVPAPEGV